MHSKTVDGRKEKVCKREGRKKVIFVPYITGIKGYRRRYLTPRKSGSARKPPDHLGMEASERRCWRPLILDLSISFSQHPLWKTPESAGRHNWTGDEEAWSGSEENTESGVVGL